MKRLSIQPIYKFLLIHLIGLLLVLIAFVGVGIHTKKSQAETIASGISQSFLIGDYRTVTTILENALSSSFENIEVLDSKDRRVIFVQNSKAQESFFQIKNQQNIYFGTKRESKQGSIVFHYGVFHVLLGGFLTYLLIIILSVPYLVFLKKRVRNEYEVELKNKEMNFRFSLAEQVSHDIRSPLAALNIVIEEFDNIPEEYRSIIRSSTQRINDIANNLLSAAKVIVNQPPSATSLKNVLIPSLIDSLISEKRMEYRHRSNIIFDIDLKNSFGAFSLVNSNELSCVISNLINNSIDAFDGNPGKIVVQVLKNKESIDLLIKDNGKGIPENILSELGKGILSHGKSHLANKGNGLGFLHAKKTIENIFDGKLQIRSKENEGTVVLIKLKKSNTPLWFSESIDFRNKKMIITVDDDHSIHQMWEKRFSEQLEWHFEHKKIYSPKELRLYLKNNAVILEDILFLIDYQFSNEITTGGDLVRELSIHKHSILVTSRYEDIDVQGCSREMDLKILPKFLVSSVPFVSEDVGAINYDVILVDDDELVRTTWEMRANRKGKKFLSLGRASDLWDRIDSIDKRCIFYVDVNLPGSENGEEITRKLSALGFENLYLSTGYEADNFKHVTWVKGIVGKGFAL